MNFKTKLVSFYFENKTQNMQKSSLKLLFFCAWKSENKGKSAMRQQINIVGKDVGIFNFSSIRGHNRHLIFQ